MDKPKELQELINSVGAMAELTVLCRKELLNKGIPAVEIKDYTKAFIAAMLGGGKGGAN